MSFLFDEPRWNKQDDGGAAYRARVDRWIGYSNKRGFLEGYALDDRGGNGYMVSVHCYPWKSGWADMFLEAAEKFPIFVGEVGSQPFPMPWEKQATDEYVWSPDMIGCIQQHKLHWAAFSFHPGASPCLIQDWSFKPTPGWGSFVKAALRGAQIRTGRMH